MLGPTTRLGQRQRPQGKRSGDSRARKEGRGPPAPCGDVDEQGARDEAGPAVRGDPHRVRDAELTARRGLDGIRVDRDVLGGGERDVEEEQGSQLRSVMRGVCAGQDRRHHSQQDQARSDPRSPASEAIDEWGPEELEHPGHRRARREADAGQAYALLRQPDGDGFVEEEVGKTRRERKRADPGESCSEWGGQSQNARAAARRQITAMMRRIPRRRLPGRVGSGAGGSAAVSTNGAVAGISSVSSASPSGRSNTRYPRPRRRTPRVSRRPRSVLPRIRGRSGPSKSRDRRRTERPVAALRTRTVLLRPPPTCRRAVRIG